MDTLFVQELTNVFTKTAVALITAQLIFWLYRLFESNWPHEYFALNNKSSIFLSTNPFWFILFRFIPVFCVTLIVFSFFKNDTMLIQERIFWGLIVGFVHAMRTDIFALYKIFINSPSILIFSNKLTQIILHLISTAIIIIFTISGAIASSVVAVQDFFPTFQGIKDEIWSAAIITIFLFLFKKSRDTIELLGYKSSIKLHKNLVRTIKSEVKKEIENQSKIHNANKYLVQAVAIMENIQRPSWVRKIERLKSFFIKRGTYGIMQVYSDCYISDTDSVKIAVEKFFKDTKKTIANPVYIRNILLKYNPSDNYVEQVLLIYEKLVPSEATDDYYKCQHCRQK